LEESKGLLDCCILSAPKWGGIGMMYCGFLSSSIWSLERRFNALSILERYVYPPLTLFKQYNEMKSGGVWI
jgi:hypothetical protein